MTIGGILRQAPPTANGVLFVTLEDETGMIQCIVYPRVQERLGHVLAQSALIVRGCVQATGAWRGLIMEEAYELAGMLGGYKGHPSASGGTDIAVQGIDTSVSGETMRNL